MFAVEVELLTGRYTATSHVDRGRGEWPPHPARFFSALVAALHDFEPNDHDEREALLWLEKQPAPSLRVSLEAARRTVRDVFVPVNDVTLIGDPEHDLRLAQDRVTALASNAASVDLSFLKKARKEVEKQEKRLIALLRSHHSVDDSPTQTAIASAIALLPARRVRQARTFPTVVPAEDRFAFVWPVAAPAALRSALSRLCARVTRLGHSSSLVRCAVVDREITPNLTPNGQGRHILRVVEGGQLDRLEREFFRHRAVESRVLPARSQRYGEGQRESRETTSNPPTVFSRDWIVYERVGGARPLASKCVDMARALRAALIEQCGQSGVPEWLSGHSEDGQPSSETHVAFVATPSVGHPHADGAILGCAIVPPFRWDRESQGALLRLLARWEASRAIGRTGEGDTLELASDALPPVQVRRASVSIKATLDPSRWCRAARRFITATPIALDRNPGDLRSNQAAKAHRSALEAQETIAKACVRIGLPAPASVEVSLAPLLSGSLPLGAFRPWPGVPGRTPRVRVYADIRFADPVAGPLLVGAGRFYGLGLCLPMEM